MYFQGVAKDKHAALLKNVDTEHHYQSWNHRSSGVAKVTTVVKIVKTLTDSSCEVFLDVSSMSCSLDLLSPYFLENPGSFCNCLSVSGQAVSVKVHRSSTYHVKCTPWEASLRLICGLPPVDALSLQGLCVMLVFTVFNTEFKEAWGIACLGKKSPGEDPPRPPQNAVSCTRTLLLLTSVQPHRYLILWPELGPLG